MRKTPAHFSLAMAVFSDDLSGDLSSDLAKIQKFYEDSSPNPNQNFNKNSSLDSATQAQIIDIRQEKDYKQKHIKGAKNISDFESLSREILSNPNTKFLLHCYSGYTVAMIGSEIVEMGAKNVFFFDESFEDLYATLEQNPKNQNPKNEVKSK